MPEGIVPELLIALGLVIAVAIAVLLSRSRFGADEEPDYAEPSSESGPVAVVTEPAPAESAPSTVTPEVEAPPARPSLSERLARSRDFLSARLSGALGRGIAADTWDDVEAALIQADVGVGSATEIVESVQSAARQAKVTDPHDAHALVADELLNRFDATVDRGLEFAPEGVTVWLIVGVNGTGKTTTIGKLAADLRMHGKNVVVAASDTFRAAAGEQLAIWAERAGADLVGHKQGADPGAVAFDAFQHARATGADVLMVDTAGRLHTKTPLMDELAKIKRVLEKEGRVQETLLVIDATAGQNGLVQAREFAETSDVTGVVLTKLDGTAKGGIAVAIEDSLRIPIKLIGVGEGLNDLEPFEPQTYVDALLS